VHRARGSTQEAEMTPEQQRIAIAEACGKRKIIRIGFHHPHEGFVRWNSPILELWDKKIKISDSEKVGWPDNYHSSQINWCDTPDYPNDLNAMHEAEKTCIIGDEATEEKYWLCLYDATHRTRWPFDATAAQRAEAFLRTLNILPE
jgi:hypothetical protein